LIVLQEWQAGIPLEEICRKYAMNPAQMYRWKHSLEQGLKAPGELVQRVRCWACRTESRNESGRGGERPWRWRC
jgi:transposase-like protein